MYGFFRVLPLELGTLARDIVLLVVGTGLGLGVARLVALGAELPEPLTGAARRVGPRSPAARAAGPRASPGVRFAPRARRDPAPRQDPPMTRSRSSTGRSNPPTPPEPAALADADERRRHAAPGDRPDAGPPARRRTRRLAPARARRRRPPRRRGALPVRLLARRADRDDAGHARRRRRRSSRRSGTSTSRSPRATSATVDRKKLVEGAIDGMIGALGDPYSSYMSPGGAPAAPRESIGGRVRGDRRRGHHAPHGGRRPTCATLGPACRLVVVAPIDGSPAEKAGLLGRATSSRRSTARTVDGQTLDEAIARVRGPKGTDGRR